MPTITVHDKQFEPYISASQIQEKIKELAAALDRDYQGKNPLFIAILNGSFMFAADLFKELKNASEICFIKLASYKGSKSSGHVITSIGLVIIVEDIIDTGKTMSEFLPQLLHQHPASLSICALLHKPDAVQYPVKIDYLGFTIPNKFVVGYGLDYDGYGRNFGEIYQLAE